MIYIGADHRGYKHKEYIKRRFTEENLAFVDKGDEVLNSQDDYVDYAKAVGDEVIKDPSHKGVLLCGSGVGVDMVANKIDGVRCSLVHDNSGAQQSREHEDANVIALPADKLHEEEAYQIIKTFLTTPFSGEARHVRRLEKMKQIEEHN
jgi:ribose 5-phosphate isomerase B